MGPTQTHTLHGCSKAIVHDFAILSCAAMLGFLPTTLPNKAFFLCFLQFIWALNSLTWSQFAGTFTPEKIALCQHTWLLIHLLILMETVLSFSAGLLYHNGSTIYFFKLPCYSRLRNNIIQKHVLSINLPSAIWLKRLGHSNRLCFY